MTCLFLQEIFCYLEYWLKISAQFQFSMQKRCKNCIWQIVVRNIQGQIIILIIQLSLQKSGWNNLQKMLL